MPSFSKWFTAVPQPLPTFTALYMASFVIPIVALVSGIDSGWVIAPTALCAMAMGFCLLTNLRGGSEAWAQVMREQRPLGVDYSGSPLASKAFVRFFGGMMTVIGTFMLMGSLSGTA